MRVHQCAVMGSGGVGKSAVTVRFINGSYLEWYDPTSTRRFMKQFMVDRQPCLLEILDTAGVDQYLSLNDMFVRESEGFVLVFSLTQRDTFDEIARLRETIMRIKQPPEGVKVPMVIVGSRSLPPEGVKVPMVIVGNKADLEDEREVGTGEGEKLAAMWGCNYHETSARLDKAILGVFEDIVRQLRTTKFGRRAEQQTRKSRKCIVL